jgi:Uma2 family endonuclease
MAQALSDPRPVWTVADILARFGALPISRIRQDPAPGTAKEADVTRIHDREKRLYELVDGVLIEKTMGFEESWLAHQIGVFLSNFAKPRKLGLVTGADGTIKLVPGLVRIPDVAFFSCERLKGRMPPYPPIPHLVPDLAVEVLSESNTEEEMEEKLRDYLKAGVRLVWYVDPQAHTVKVHAPRKRARTLRLGQRLDGGAVLEGFSVTLKELFAPPLEE